MREEWPTRRAQALGTLALAVLLAASAAIRIHMGLSHPYFDTARSERLLKSDPALLYYFTQRILENGGLPPADFRADPRVEYPDRVDVPAMFTVGQELLVAWAALAVGDRLPLHVLCVIVMGIIASLVGVGVYGVALELTRRVSWALLAALLYAASPASYRTIGFILVREDLSLPFYALHLYLLARALRVRTAGAALASALALAAALATWHAMTFVFAVEMACVLAWFLRAGRNPLEARHAWIVPATLLAAGLAVPVLRAKLFVLSLPMQILLALWAASTQAGASRARRVGLALSAWLVLLALSRAVPAWTGWGGADYDHVWALFWAKLRFLGELPADPSALPFGARLLWQGPFETAQLRELVAGFSVGAVLLPVAALAALPIWWRGRGDDRAAVLVAMAVAWALCAWMVRRNLALYGFVTAPVCALLLRQLLPDARRTWLVGLALAQLVAGASVIPHRDLHWYFPVQQDELEALIGWVRESLPAEAELAGEEGDAGAVATDFVNGPALLAQTGHPILLQPKYETASSRRRTEEFLHAFFHEDVEALHDWLLRHRARYLLVDRQTLWLFRYVAGLPLALRQPTPWTSAARFLGTDPSVYDGIPGFRLLYRSALPSDMMRLYEVR